MSDRTYGGAGRGSGKDIVWLHGEIKTPPISRDARREVGTHLRRLQKGERIPMPHSRPMPTIGPRCHELRIHDSESDWRVIYRIDPQAILILDVFQKRSQKTPPRVLTACRRRLRSFDQ